MFQLHVRRLADASGKLVEKRESEQERIDWAEMEINDDPTS